MEIAILGTGCSKCKRLYERVRKVAEEMQSPATIRKVEELTEIMKSGVMSMPAVVIDGTVVMQGGIPKESEIKAWLSKGQPDLKELVRQRYNELALSDQAPESCCCNPMAPAAPSGKVFTLMSEDYSQLKGYEPDADLGVGCGLPTQYARIQKGDTVVDLGSGAGNDCFIAREETGAEGQVFGIDFAPQMLARARANAARRGFTNIEFLEGDIENMPLPGKTADVVVSNCVLNLLPRKDRIFNEICRVLKPGGHFCISDVVLDGTFPKEFTDNAALYAGCIASAIQREEYLGEIEKAGFSDIKVERTKTVSIPDEVLQEHLDEAILAKYKAGNVGIYSITVTGKRPAE